MAPNENHQRMATHEPNPAPSLDFPPARIPIVPSVRKERGAYRVRRSGAPLWIDHVMQGIPLPSGDTHVPESGGLGRW